MWNEGGFVGSDFLAIVLQVSASAKYIQPGPAARRAPVSDRWLFRWESAKPATSTGVTVTVAVEGCSWCAAIVPATRLLVPLSAVTCAQRPLDELPASDSRSGGGAVLVSALTVHYS